MKAFRCRVCGNPLHAENSVCVSCGTSLGYSREEQAIVPVDEQGRYADATGVKWWVCTNLGLSGCTWLAPRPGGQCSACDLTRTRPADGDAVGLEQFPAAEAAKRHLVAELDGLGWWLVDRVRDPEGGLWFDMLSSVSDDVTIGHADGVITIDLAESDDAHREEVRASLDEPYRTMLGHLRHEVGHYAEWQLVRGESRMARCRMLFGDETVSYQDEIDRHYAEGPPADWAERYISTYATMHPFEDFAETWAHFLHITDSVETARSYGLLVGVPTPAGTRFRDLVTEVWAPLSIALNQMNRSMGKHDFYPFVIPAPVLDKLEFVAGLLPPRR
ncbi:zinc-binding metallopeptidase family protein [Nocardioides litoris]|uniref:zinc-binding metallopeptidase family protein n=1 Tax=Nocardioides litoris TaxID=1926648 RepID=UPI00112496C7|nr:putative zinc-binding metallopeptidase [Nocardioides litoris]